tara:strand:- start:55 stop:633 length:579 start_codon:yes stop_codon:yes gene_type:complete
MENFDLKKYLAENKLLKEYIDFPEMEEEFEGAMDAMVVEPEVYLQDIINASPEEIVSDDYYEIMNAVEQGVYSAEEAVELAKSWAKEKLTGLSENKLLKEEIKFINYVTVDQDEFKAQYDKHYDDYGNDEDFIEEYGRDFLSPNIEAINQYYGDRVHADDVITDFFEAGGINNISSNEEFEEWLDKNREFYI